MDRVACQATWSHKRVRHDLVTKQQHSFKGYIVLWKLENNKQHFKNTKLCKKLQWNQHAFLIH